MNKKHNIIKNNKFIIKKIDLYNQLYEAEQLEEGINKVISTFALSLALSIPGLVSAKTLQNAQHVLKITSSQIQKKQNEFIQSLNGFDPHKMMNDYEMWQALNILALTLYGEGRSEINNDGFDYITDTLLNRTATTPDTNRVANVCVGKKAGHLYQYSFWNKNKKSLESIKAGTAVLPKSISTDVIEKNAWEICLTQAVKVITGKYKIKNTKINSYYKTNMKNPPSWTNKLTDKVTAGKHTFGYLISNDPKYVDMTNMTLIKKIKKTDIKNDNTTVKKNKKPNNIHYKIKKHDTLTSIANKYKTTVKSIMSKNKKIKNVNKLKIGQDIII